MRLTSIFKSVIIHLDHFLPNHFRADAEEQKEELHAGQIPKQTQIQEKSVLKTEDFLSSSWPAEVSSQYHTWLKSSKTKKQQNYESGISFRRQRHERTVENLSSDNSSLSWWWLSASKNKIKMQQGVGKFNEYFIMALPGSLFGRSFKQITH